MDTSGLQGAAATAKTIVEEVAKFEPWMEMVLPIFVPASGPAIKVVHSFSPIILAFAARALDDLAKGNNGDIPTALIDLFQHLTKGQPNSLVLADRPPPPDDPSRQGSG